MLPVFWAAAFDKSANNAPQARFANETQRFVCRVPKCLTLALFRPAVLLLRNAQREDPDHAAYFRAVFQRLPVCIKSNVLFADLSDDAGFFERLFFGGSVRSQSGLGPTFRCDPPTGIARRDEHYFDARILRYAIGQCGILNSLSSTFLARHCLRPAIRLET